MQSILAIRDSSQGSLSSFCSSKPSRASSVAFPELVIQAHWLKARRNHVSPAGNEGSSRHSTVAGIRQTVSHSSDSLISLFAISLSRPVAVCGVNDDHMLGWMSPRGRALAGIQKSNLAFPELRLGTGHSRVRQLTVLLSITGTFQPDKVLSLFILPTLHGSEGLSSSPPTRIVSWLLPVGGSWQIRKCRQSIPLKLDSGHLQSSINLKRSSQSIILDSLLISYQTQLTAQLTGHSNIPYPTSHLGPSQVSLGSPACSPQVKLPTHRDLPSSQTEHHCTNLALGATFAPLDFPSNVPSLWAYQNLLGLSPTSLPPPATNFFNRAPESNLLPKSKPPSPPTDPFSQPIIQLPSISSIQSFGPNSLSGLSQTLPGAQPLTTDPNYHKLSEFSPYYHRGSPVPKMFKCTLDPNCDMEFTRAEHLARHERKHTKEKPFKCHCSKSFSRLDNWRQHKVSVHKEDIEANAQTEERLIQVHKTMQRQNNIRKAATIAAQRHGHLEITPPIVSAQAVIVASPYSPDSTSYSEASSRRQSEGSLDHLVSQSDPRFNLTLDSVPAESGEVHWNAQFQQGPINYSTTIPGSHLSSPSNELAHNPFAQSLGYSTLPGHPTSDALYHSSFLPPNNPSSFTPPNFSAVTSPYLFSGIPDFVLSPFPQPIHISQPYSPLDKNIGPQQPISSYPQPTNQGVIPLAWAHHWEGNSPLLNQLDSRRPNAEESGFLKFREPLVGAPGSLEVLEAPQRKDEISNPKWGSPSSLESQSSYREAENSLDSNLALIDSQVYKCLVEYNSYRNDNLCQGEMIDKRTNQQVGRKRSFDGHEVKEIGSICSNKNNGSEERVGTKKIKM
ncbi:hypothetical protein O181_055050 [Austropuccinia psidii MF-1]|uniref:C2H2-type domain-containing protein n=1 Tax=Austropuccinia psidii MF-1 TaxID=1389203 RepID=A0A9Q3HUX0_9BASI|nr:hypothetical protein [Austropuccinia psidii MF-1]